MKKKGEAEKKWSKEELVGNKTNKHCKFVVSLGQETSDAIEQNDVEATVKNAPEESKMLERTDSDERSQESDKAVEQDPEAENSDEVEDDVKVCDICGDVGQEDLLVFCTRCSDGAEHTYCMRVMMKKPPEGEWLCEECQIDEETNNSG
ncbi:Zinc finger protein DPF3 [Carex littledalei]|uniref:Zinc finger protein DPF3 n=1 Tax=Carex littledalei TaxID=544730 RepID=A0A833VCB4_9POAL|nr:Zinc finger protein DPF3 [Carex littledalei]